jgi:hypothetical protein
VTQKSEVKRSQELSCVGVADGEGVGGKNVWVEMIFVFTTPVGVSIALELSHETSATNTKRNNVFFSRG